MKGLNPCSNGRCSASFYRSLPRELQEVLILVLMEDALRVNPNCLEKLLKMVLILVLMEDALREFNHGLITSD